MKEFIAKHKKKLILFGSIIILFGIIISVLIVMISKKKEMPEFDMSQMMRRTSSYSDQIELEGTVSVGSEIEKFTLDIAGFSGESFEWGSSGSFGGGMGNMGEMPSMGGAMPGGSSMPGGSGGSNGAGMSMGSVGTAASNSSSESRELLVDEIYIQVGQQINAGDVILKVSDESLKKLRQDFEDDVQEAKNIYDQALTSQQQAEYEAKLTQNENELYGNYAAVEYENSIDLLNASIESLQESITEKNESIADLQEEIISLQSDLPTHQTALNNAIYARDQEGPLENPYGWITAENSRIELETLIESVNETIEADYEEIETLTKELESLNLELKAAECELKKGQIEAESAKQTRMINADNAQEIYDYTVELAAFTTQNALTDYEEAQEKLSVFDSYLPDGCLLAENDGVVTSVSVAVGDSLSRNMELISVNNYKAVTITLSVDESDMEAASLGSKAEIYFIAYQDEVFEGEVTNIGDAEMDSNTNTTVYEVEVTIDAEKGSKLYEGMTAAVVLTRPKNSTPGNMPEGFDPGSMPEGFGEGQMPEGFDPGNMPEGMTPPQGMSMPGGRMGGGQNAAE